MWYVKTKSVDEWGNVRNCNYEPAFKLTQDKYSNYYYKGRIVDKTTYDTSEDDYSSKFFFTKLKGNYAETIYDSSYWKNPVTGE